MIAYKKNGPVALAKYAQAAINSGVNGESIGCTEADQSSNASAGGSIGVGFALGSKTGFTIDVGANKAQGSGNGQGVSYTNTQIAAGNSVTLKSGQDTSLKGAVTLGSVGFPVATRPVKIYPV